MSTNPTIVRDLNGSKLTYKDSSGYWYEYACDLHGNELTFKDSKGCWYEYTRDLNGNELTFKNSSGCWHCLATYEPYILRYNQETGIYWAGCRSFTREQALAHWGNPKRTDDRAILFKFAIRMNEHKQENDV